jgi:hypothetical protein
MRAIESDPERCDLCGEPLDGEPRAEVYLVQPNGELDLEGPVHVIHQSCMTDEYEVA